VLLENGHCLGFNSRSLTSLASCLGVSLGRLARTSAAFFSRQSINTHSNRRMTMIGRITFWYSYALNLPRRRSADFQISSARLSSLCLFRTGEVFAIRVRV